MEYDNATIILDKELYNKLVLKKDVIVNSNLITKEISKQLLSQFALDNDFYSVLIDAIKFKTPVSLALHLNNELMAQESYSVTTIIEGLRFLSETSLKNDIELKHKIKYLLKISDFNTYVSKSGKIIKEYNIDKKSIKLSIQEIVDGAIDFFTNENKIYDLKIEEFIFILKSFINEEQIFNNYICSNEFVKICNNLINTYDTEAINKFLDSKKIDASLNEELEVEIEKLIPKNCQRLEKIIYIYYYLFSNLNYDIEASLLSSCVKNHQNLSRISEINFNNNYVNENEFNYIFMLFLKKNHVNFDYTDKYISFRINKYLIKVKTIEEAKDNILDNIRLLNKNKKTIDQFKKILNKVNLKIYFDLLNQRTKEFSFNDSLITYKINSSHNNLDFNRKFKLFLQALKNIKEEQWIGYINNLKKIFFDKKDLNANISFALMSNRNNLIIVAVINKTNLNLYNSNLYYVFDFPKKMHVYTLTEIRREMFKSNIFYIKGTKDSLIGIERSNV